MSSEVDLLARWEEALAALFAGRRAEARARLTALWPAVPEAAERLGELAFAERDYAEAARRFEGAHREDVLSVEGYAHWGYALCLGGEALRGFEAFEAGVARHPGARELHEGVLTLATTLGLPSRAREALRALSYFPDRRASAEAALAELADRPAAPEAGELTAIRPPRRPPSGGPALPGRSPGTRPLGRTGELPRAPMPRESRLGLRPE